MRKTLPGLIAFAAAGTLALTACSSDRTSTPAETTTNNTAAATSGALCIPDGATIGVALPQKTSENWVLAEQLFNDGLTAAGFKGIVQFGNSGVTEQQNQIDAMVEQGAKVIVVGAIDGSQLGTQLEAAKATGATIIAYDRLVKNTAAVDAYIAFDNYKVGVLQGTALMQGLKERKGDGPVQHRADRRFF